MEYRRLGKSGLKASVVGLGTNAFGSRIDEAASITVMQRAIDCGINFIDTADVYGRGESERFIGKAIKGRRDGVIIATKFRSSMGEGPNERGGSRLYIRRAVEASLQRLDTDYIDLYQMHSPDPETPIEETLSALDDLIHEGKVRYIGNSNFAGWQIADAAWTARVNRFVGFISAQNHYSLLQREVEKEVIPACEHFGLGMIPFFPLAAGLLTGKYHRGQPPPPDTRFGRNPAAAERWLQDARLAAVERLQDWAAKNGVAILQVALGALAAQPTVATVIVGATRPEQVEANAEAGQWQPTPEQLAEIEQIVPGLHARE